MKNEIIEAALLERQEYLEELLLTQALVKQQIKIVQLDIENLLLKITQESNNST